MAWIDVKHRLPTTAGPFLVFCPPSGNGQLTQDIRIIYFNTEQGRSHRVLETKGIFRCCRLITHWAPLLPPPTEEDNEQRKQNTELSIPIKGGV